MRRLILAVSLLTATTASAAPSPQQRCDQARLIAWSRFATCIYATQARYGMKKFDANFQFARCRNRYASRWVRWQQTPTLRGSTCVALSRFFNRGDEVHDALTGLTWEEKSDGAAHNVNERYNWSVGTWATGWREDGSAWDAITQTNTEALANSRGWRMPTLVELQSLLYPYPCVGAGGGPNCTCPRHPCISGAFGASSAVLHWSSTRWAGQGNYVWAVEFYGGAVYPTDVLTQAAVRAVRGGM